MLPCPAPPHRNPAETARLIFAARPSAIPGTYPHAPPPPASRSRSPPASSAARPFHHHQLFIQMLQPRRKTDLTRAARHSPYRPAPAGIAPLPPSATLRAASSYSLSFPCGTFGGMITTTPGNPVNLQNPSASFSARFARMNRHQRNIHQSAAKPLAQ